MRRQLVFKENGVMLWQINWQQSFRQVHSPSSSHRYKIVNVVRESEPEQNTNATVLVYVKELVKECTMASITLATRHLGGKRYSLMKVTESRDEDI